MHTADFAWLSQLQRRADYARKSALGARTPAIARELAELAALYDSVAGRTEVEAEREASRKGAALLRVDEGKDDLIRHLMSRAAGLLVEARNQSDEKRADELKYLAGVYGAEAARLKTNSMR
jgi:hypothetical protein